jgi:hypothetical protein
MAAAAANGAGNDEDDGDDAAVGRYLLTSSSVPVLERPELAGSAVDELAEPDAAVSDDATAWLAGLDETDAEAVSQRAGGALSLLPEAPVCGKWCPVAMVDEEVRVPGSARHAVVVAGRVYRCCGPAAAARFALCPARYIVALRGMQLASGSAPETADQQHPFARWWQAISDCEGAARDTALLGVAGAPQGRKSLPPPCVLVVTQDCADPAMAEAMVARAAAKTGMRLASVKDALRECDAAWRRSERLDNALRAELVRAAEEARKATFVAEDARRAVLEVLSPSEEDDEAQGRADQEEEELDEEAMRAAAKLAVEGDPLISRLRDAFTEAKDDADQATNKAARLAVAEAALRRGRSVTVLVADLGTDGHAVAADDADAGAVESRFGGTASGQSCSVTWQSSWFPAPAQLRVAMRKLLAASPDGCIIAAQSLPRPLDASLAAELLRLRVPPSSVVVLRNSAGRGARAVAMEWAVRAAAGGADTGGMTIADAKRLRRSRRRALREALPAAKAASVQTARAVNVFAAAGVTVAPSIRASLPCGHSQHVTDARQRAAAWQAADRRLVTEIRAIQGTELPASFAAAAGGKTADCATGSGMGAALLPPSVALQLMRQGRLRASEWGGVCPVAASRGSAQDWQQQQRLGDPALTAVVGGRVFLLSSATAARQFVLNPWQHLASAAARSALAARGAAGDAALRASSAPCAVVVGSDEQGAVTAAAARAAVAVGGVRESAVLTLADALAWAVKPHTDVLASGAGLRDCALVRRVAALMGLVRGPRVAAYAPMASTIATQTQHSTTVPLSKADGRLGLEALCLLLSGSSIRSAFGLRHTSGSAVWAVSAGGALEAGAGGRAGGVSGVVSVAIAGLPGAGAGADWAGMLQWMQQGMGVKPACLLVVDSPTDSLAAAIDERAEAECRRVRSGGSWDTAPRGAGVLRRPVPGGALALLAAPWAVDRAEAAAQEAEEEAAGADASGVCEHDAPLGSASTTRQSGVCEHDAPLGPVSVSSAAADQIRRLAAASAVEQQCSGDGVAGSRSVMLRDALAAVVGPEAGEAMTGGEVAYGRLGSALSGEEADAAEAAVSSGARNGAEDEDQAVRASLEEEAGDGAGAGAVELEQSLRAGAASRLGWAASLAVASRALRGVGGKLMADALVACAVGAAGTPWSDAARGAEGTAWDGGDEAWLSAVDALAERAGPAAWADREAAKVSGLAAWDVQATGERDAADDDDKEDDADRAEAAAACYATMPASRWQCWVMLSGRPAAMGAPIGALGAGAVFRGARFGAGGRAAAAGGGADGEQDGSGARLLGAGAGWEEDDDAMEEADTLAAESGAASSLPGVMRAQQRFRGAGGSWLKRTGVGWTATTDPVQAIAGGAAGSLAPLRLLLPPLPQSGKSPSDAVSAPWGATMQAAALGLPLGVASLAPPSRALRQGVPTAFTGLWPVDPSCGPQWAMGHAQRLQKAVSALLASCDSPGALMTAIQVSSASTSVAAVTASASAVAIWALTVASAAGSAVAVPTSVISPSDSAMLESSAARACCPVSWHTGRHIVDRAAAGSSSSALGPGSAVWSAIKASSVAGPGAVLYRGRAYFPASAAHCKRLEAAPTLLLSGPATVVPTERPRVLRPAEWAALPPAFEADGVRIGDAETGFPVDTRVQCPLRALAARGMCPVSLRDAFESCHGEHGWSLHALHGRADLTVQFGRRADATVDACPGWSRLWRLSSVAALNRFLRTPWAFTSHPACDAASSVSLPPPSFPQIAQSPSAEPSPVSASAAAEPSSVQGLVQVQCGHSVEAALASLAQLRAVLRHPSMTVRGSALAYLALHLRAYNPHLRPAQRARARRRLEQFVRECKSARLLAAGDQAMPVAGGAETTARKPHRPPLRADHAAAAGDAEQESKAQSPRERGSQVTLTTASHNRMSRLKKRSVSLRLSGDDAGKADPAESKTSAGDMEGNWTAFDALSTRRSDETEQWLKLG